MRIFPSASFAPRVSLAASLAFCGFLGGCDLLGPLVCDYETDPACEDPERGHIEGRITVPTAAAAQSRGAPQGLLLRARQALLEAHAREPAAKAPQEAQLPDAKYRVPRAGFANQLSSKLTSEERWREGEVIVRAKEPVREERDRFADDLQGFLGDVEVKIGLCNTEHLCLAHVRHEDGRSLDALETLDVARRLRRHEGLAYAEVNRVLQITRAPNDQLYPLQWHYSALRLPTAWNITTGHPDVVAAVIDTGILTDHPDLEGRVIGGADLISDADVAGDGDGRDDDGYDVGDNACGDGCHSHHGTHVAGTMAARTDNADMVAGVSWEGQLLSVRVLGQGGGSVFDIVGGIYWALGSDVEGVSRNPSPADVINLSLGGRGDSEAVNEAVQAAIDFGTLVVVAAGNDNADASEYTPANAPGAITVAALGNTGDGRARPKKASYSNFGAVVDVAAPGGELAEDADGDGHPDGVLSTVGRDVEFYQGTSMAAPHVAGVAMLMKALDPNLRQGEAKQILSRTADANIDCSQGCGAGLVNAAQALRDMLGEADLPLVVPLPDVVRVGRADLDAEVHFANEGGAPVDVTLSVGGPDRARITLDTTGVRLEPGDVLTVRVDIDRTGEDLGEATLSAAFGEGQVAEARILWTDRAINVARAASVGALRIEDDEIIPERIVTASAVDDYAYKLFNLTPGDYLIIGLSDDDNDGEYEEHEGLGVYPFIQQPELLRVEASLRITDADFVVAPGFVYEDGEGAGDGPVGAACDDSFDCLGGLYCEPAFPGGYCTRDCSAGNECPAGSDCFCLQDDTGACAYSICLKTCSDDAECRTGEGYVCDIDATCYPG